MIEIAVDVLKFVGPLLVAIYRRGLEGQSQKELAQSLNKSEPWVSRRVQVAVEQGLLKVTEKDVWGWHRIYSTYAKWKVNSVWLTEKGRDVAETLVQLDPIIELCPRCRNGIDVTGYSGIIACPYCAYEFNVEGVEPQRPLTGMPWWAYFISFLMGIFCAALDTKNRWRGFGIGTAMSTTVTALLDGYLRLSSGYYIMA
jgi:DNA-binding Lrp family transcriptional regulator